MIISLLGMGKEGCCAVWQIIECQEELIFMHCSDDEFHNFQKYKLEEIKKYVNGCNDYQYDAKESICMPNFDEPNCFSKLQPEFSKCQHDAKIKWQLNSGNFLIIFNRSAFMKCTECRKPGLYQHKFLK